MATQSQASIPLITVEENSEKFVLNPEAISMIEQLSSPIKVIAAIGDARIGKSTALNFIHNSMSNIDNAEEIFKTGDTMKPVTNGIWIAKPNGEGGMKNVILLDVEGTDLGNDEVTDKLSIFTALTSSKLMLFMKESPSTHILDFLYKIVRLTELAFGEMESEYFPRLTAVLRGALAAPEDYENIEEYIIHALTCPNWKDESDEKRKAIGTRFPSENIAVFNLPYDATLRQTPRISQPVQGSEYLESIETLTKHILDSDEKKSLQGGVALDGKSLVQLAKSVVEIMNKDLWKELNPNFYELFEEDLCTRSYDEYIKPLLTNDEHTAQYMEENKEEKLRLFEEKCKLEKCIKRAKTDIDSAIKDRKQREKKATLRKIGAGLVVAGGVAAGAAVVGPTAAVGTLLRTTGGEAVIATVGETLKATVLTTLGAAVGFLLRR